MAGVFCTFAILTLAVAPRMLGQAAAPAPAPGTGTETTEETIRLSPFMVSADEDVGYQATSTLAGTRVRTELKDTASAISVVTSAFLQDTGSKNAKDLLIYTTSTEVAGLRGNFSAQAGQSIYQENLLPVLANTRVRGLDAADNTRDYFLTDIPWDGFNVGRVDLQRGPNSILFGVGSPAGINNTSLNSAGFKNSNKIENVTSSYGSERWLVDFNHVILPNELAIRFAAVNDRARFKQEPAFSNDTRYYGALRFDPKIFNSESAHTSFRANFENGTVKSNMPRTIPPTDEITPWFLTGTDAYGNPRLNKLTINQYNPGEGNNSTLVNSTYNLGSWAQGRTYWSDPLCFFNGSASSTPGVSPTVLSGIPTMVITGMLTAGWKVDTTGAIGAPYNPGASANIGGFPNYKPQSIPDYNQFAKFAPHALPGGAYYADKVLTDSSIFDFYSLLLDGPNKREWQNWNAYNVALSQTFWNDRLGIELVYDKQTYKQGQVGFMSGGANYAITIDVNQVLIDGTPNPNVGRPMVANSAAGGNNELTTLRDSSRATAFADLRFKDFMGDTALAKILGRHVLTAIANLDHKTQTQVTWSEYAADANWELDNNLQLNTKIMNYRQFDWVDYIGPTLAGWSSAANAHLQNIKTIIAPPASSAVKFFDSHWNRSLVPLLADGVTPNPNYVNPAAPYTYLHSDTAVVVTSTQSENPANYVGWRNGASQLTVGWERASNPAQFPDLVTGGFRTQYRNMSEAFAWQAYLLNSDSLGEIVGTFGWRKDSVVNYSTAAPVDGLTGVTALNYGTDTSSTGRSTVDGQSRTWGGVYHFPKALMSHIPGGTMFSVFYDKSSNFKADAPRTNLKGDTLPNPDGQTKEYGVTISTLDDKLSLKFGRYETTVHNATFNVTVGNSIAGLGGNGYWMWAAPSWGYGYAAMLQEGLNGAWGSASSTANRWNYAWTDLNAAGATPAQLAAVASPAAAATVVVGHNGAPDASGGAAVTMVDIVNAWKALPVADSFFNYYGINPTINPAKAHASGRLADAFANWNDGAPVGGQQPAVPQVVSTVDNISKGTEIELAGQLTRNWNISANYAKTDATKTNIDTATVQFMADNLAFANGPGGQLRLWGQQTYYRGCLVGPNWIDNVYKPYQVSALAAGQSTPEISPWRLNLTTTYTIDHGRAKGVSIGGGMRVEAGRILGYPYKASIDNLDVTNPQKGPKDEHFDMWIRYSKKFVCKDRSLNWSIQANIRNVGERYKLVASRYEPDGSLALARISEGMTWQITNTLEF
jgi:hypothetical protein